MYLFPLGKRILAIRAVSSGISGNLWGCRDIAFLLLLSTFLLPSYYSSPKYPSFLSLCQYHWSTESLRGSQHFSPIRTNLRTLLAHGKTGRTGAFLLV